MRVRALITGVLFLLVAGSALAAVKVTAEDGAKLRVDAAKFAKITDKAIRSAAPKSAVNISIVIGKPEVWLSTHPIRVGQPLPPDVVPPKDDGWRPERGKMTVFETVRARYTIIDASGAMIESEALVFDVGHGNTLEAQLRAMRTTAAYIASRVAEVTR